MKRTDLALAALASAAVPGMKPVAVARLSVEPGAESELQHAVVEDATGRRWLVRSPLTAMAGARLQRNDELVRQLARHLPFKVPAAAGYAAAGTEGHAAVYPHVEGATLDFTRVPAGAGLAHAIGRAVAAVHNIPAAVFEQQDVPSFDAAGCRQRLIAEVDRAAETGRVPTRLLARWEEAFDAPALWQFASTPVHGSFRGATVVVAFADEEADSGRVVAVTDWDEAMVGDPAVDFADLYSQASPQTWESVLDSYALTRAQRPDPYLHARARLLSETGRLRGLALHVSAGEEEQARRIVEGLRRMDRLTEDEDSLVPATARGAGAGPAATLPPRVATADGEGGAVSDTDDATTRGADDVVDATSRGVDDATAPGTDEEGATPAGHEAAEAGDDGAATVEDLQDVDDEDDDLRDAPADPDPFLDDGDPDPHPDDETVRGDTLSPGPEDRLVPDTDITADIPVLSAPRQVDAAPALLEDTTPSVPASQDGTRIAGADDGDGSATGTGEDDLPDANGDDPVLPQTDEESGTADEDESTSLPTDTDLLDDDTRLHELYGMPPADDPRA